MTARKANRSTACGCAGPRILSWLTKSLQPDGTTDNFPVALRRTIGLVRLSGDDRNDRDLRLVQGSALDRLLSDKGLRSRLVSELAKNDVNEVLLCSDLRFWAEVVEEDGSLGRRLFQKSPVSTVREVVSELGLATAFWTIEVSPPISIEDLRSSRASLDECLAKTLQEIPIVPGGTIHLRRRDCGPAD